MILRPGQIFGGGIPLINGAVARRAGGRWLVLGDGKLELPLVYIDDVVDAIMAAVDKSARRRRGHPDHRPRAAHPGGGARARRRRRGESMRVPRPVVFALGKLSEYPLGALGVQSPVALYRLRSGLARVEFESRRAEERLGWSPRVGVREGIRRVSTATPMRSD